MKRLTWAPSKPKYRRWLRTLSKERTIQDEQTALAFLKRLTPKHSVLAHPEFLRNYGIEWCFRWEAPNTDPRVGPFGMPTIVMTPFEVAFPISERELATRALDAMAFSFEHEFEESFCFDGQRVLDPHNERRGTRE